MDNHKDLFNLLKIKLSQKYDDIDVEKEFMTADLLNGKLALRKNYSAVTLESAEKVEFLNSLLNEIKRFESIAEIQKELSRLQQE